MHDLQVIKDQIERHEKSASELEISGNDRRNLQQEIHTYTEDFLDKLKTAKTFNDNKSQQILSDKWSINKPSSIEEITTLFQTEMDGIGLNPASGGHLGYIPGGGVYPAALGDYVAAVTNHYSTVHYAGPAAVELENYLVKWIGQNLGFSDNAVGNLTSGGSIANLQAIIVARDKYKIMDNHPREFCIYMSRQSHHSLSKAIHIAGLAHCPIRYVDVDDKFRIDTQHFQELVEVDLAQGKCPFLCISNFGTTDTGAVDPIGTLADICIKHNIWIHVDAAYGGFFQLVAKDLEIQSDYFHRVDSVTIDPHKGLFLPYGTGACLFKHTTDLLNSFQKEAGYMQDAAHQAILSSTDTSIELSRHFRGLRMWMPLKLLGVERFKAALSEKLWLCRYFYHKVQDLGFTVGPYPDLSVMIYRYTRTDMELNEFNQKLIDEVHADGEVFISSTTIDGEIWLRLAVLSFRTHRHTIDQCLEMLRRALTKLETTQGKDRFM